MLNLSFFVFVGVPCGRADLRVPFKDIKDNKISLEVLHMGSIPLKHPSSYGVGTLKRIISLKDDIIFRLNEPASIPSTTSATTTTTLGISTSSSVPGVAATTSVSVTTHNQSSSATLSVSGVATHDLLSCHTTNLHQQHRQSLE